MRIAFDGTTLRPARTGVGYYTEHLPHYRAKESVDDEIIVVSNRPLDTICPLPPQVRGVASPSRMPSLMGMQMIAPLSLRRLRVDRANFTNGMVPLAVSIPMVVTIHDMSLTMFPKYHPPRRVLLNRPLVDVAAGRADATLPVPGGRKRH